MKRRDRWVAPHEDGRLLIDPPLDSLHRLCELNHQRLHAAEVFAQPLREWRQAWRRTTSDSPLVVTGHQPDWIHPGVWIKHFVACTGARRLNGRSLHVSIDTDVIKMWALVLPRYAAEASKVALEGIPYDHREGEIIWAAATIRDNELFRALPDQFSHMTSTWPFRPIFSEFWQRLTAQIGEKPSPRWLWADALDHARRSFETEWGAGNDEVSARQLWEEKARSFLSDLLRDLPRFRDIYNQAVRAYRRRHGLRSRQHPVPELVELDGMLEAPCWFVQEGRRYRGWVRKVGQRWEGRIGATDRRPIADEGCLASRIADIWGFAVYPRALLTTLMLRLFLADVFIHGIGGAKYDEVTDDIIRGYFGIEPPDYLVVSGTLRLPFPLFPASDERRRALQARLRALRWHPEQFLDFPHALAEQKERWRRWQPLTRSERKARYRELLALTEGLRPLVEPLRLAAEAESRQLEQELAANAILTRRDYAWMLHPADRLREFLTQVV